MLFTQHKLSAESRAFIQGIQTYSTGGMNFVSTAVAKAIANRLPLPQHESTQPGVEYLELHDENVRKIVGTINEVMVLNIQEILELTRSFWLTRFHVAFPSLYVMGTDDCLGAVLGYATTISPDTLCVIKKDPVKLLESINGFTRVFCDLGFFTAVSE